MNIDTLINVINNNCDHLLFHAKIAAVKGLLEDFVLNFILVVILVLSVVPGTC